LLLASAAVVLLVQTVHYTVANVATNTFTVTVGSATTNGNVTMYAVVLAEFDSSNATSFYTLIPGEGILADEGIYVGLPADVTTTLFLRISCYDANRR
jgi:hypothetical protein